MPSGPAALSGGSNFRRETISSNVGALLSCGSGGFGGGVKGGGGVRIGVLCVWLPTHTSGRRVHPVGDAQGQTCVGGKLQRLL